MIRFDQGNHRFNYRVAGVAIHEERVLLHQGAGEDYWSLPGGRVEFGEAAEQTIRREMREELDIDIDIVRLLWVAENFFALGGMDYHELSLYFLMRLPNESKYMTQPGPYKCAEADRNLTFQWFPTQPEVLDGLSLRPSFLCAELQQLPQTLQHRIHRGE